MNQTQEAEELETEGEETEIEGEVTETEKTETEETDPYLSLIEGGMEIKDLSPMEGWYISAKVYLVDRDEWYYFIFDSTGRGIVRIQNRFFWLEKE